MKRTIILLLMFAFLSHAGEAQVDKDLKTRIDSVLMYTQAGNFERLLDFTYPKLFKIAPREQIAEAMRNATDGDDYTSSMDSVTLLKINPVFSLQGGQYAVILHSMLLKMKFKKPITDEQAVAVMDVMEDNFGRENLRFDKKNNTMVIQLRANMLAIKDSYATNWTFATYNEDDETTPLLFSRELIEKIREYK